MPYNWSTKGVLSGYWYRISAKLDDGNSSTDLSIVSKVNAVVTMPPRYYFAGFLQPINDTTINPTQSLSVFKSGSTIPVKFQLKSASGTPAQAKTLPVWLTPQKLSAMISLPNESSNADSGTSGTTFKWDSVSQQYVYNWSTKGLLAGY